MNNNLGKRGLEWAAGLLEGEGSFIPGKKGRGRACVSCTSTDKDVLESLKQILGGTICKWSHSRPGRKQAYSWYITGAERVHKVCVSLLPYMHARRALKIKTVISEYKALQQRRETRAIKKNKRIEVINKMLTDGASIKEIANSVGLSKPGVYGFMRVNGISRKQ